MIPQFQNVFQTDQTGRQISDRLKVHQNSLPKRQDYSCLIHLNCAPLVSLIYKNQLKSIPATRNLHKQVHTRTYLHTYKQSQAEQVYYIKVTAEPYVMSRNFQSSLRMHLYLRCRELRGEGGVPRERESNFTAHLVLFVAYFVSILWGP